MPTSAIQHQRPLGPLVGVAEAWERAYWAFEFRVDFDTWGLQNHPEDID